VDGEVGQGLSDEETETLLTWMSTDPQNKEQLLAMARIWDKMDVLARLSEVFPHISEQRHRARFNR
jgi:transmembrane sensor